MFKARLLQIFRKFWKTESSNAGQDAAAEPVDLQTRLQHVSELYPCAEPCVDTDHVQMHEVEMCEIDLATELEIALGTETKGLNHWASKRKKTTSSDNLKVKKLNFSNYEIDPGRSPSKASHDNLNKIGPTSQAIHEDLVLLTERELVRNHDLRRDFELLRDSGAPAINRVPERDPKFHSGQHPMSDVKSPREKRQENPQREQRELRESRPAAPQASLISDAAVRQMTRLELANKAHISRSLSGFNDELERDTVLADKWDCSEYNSLFALPDESRYGTTTEYEEDYEEDLLPYFTETLLLQEQELADSSDALQKFTASSPTLEPVKKEVQKPAPTVTGTTGKTGPGPGAGAGSGTAGATESSTALQPYKNFSENALKLIAQKPETPAPTLKWLASHTNPHIRAAVAKNPSTPGDTITVLAKDHEAGIRHSIAENPLSSMDALNLLVKDRNPLIAWRAQNTVSQIKEAQKAAQKAKDTALLETQKEAVHHVKEAKIATTEETIAFLQVIARKTNTPPRRLDDLARHADPRVRAAVAENANAPAEILWILARDPDSSVKTKVTDNYNCPIEILEAMKEDEDAYVAYQAHSVLNRILGATFSDNHLRTATWP